MEFILAADPNLREGITEREGSKETVQVKKKRHGITEREGSKESVQVKKKIHVVLGITSCGHLRKRESSCRRGSVVL